MIDALSVRQPWPYAIFYLGKDIENRNRILPKMIGKAIAIHSSMVMPMDEYDAFCFFIKRKFGSELAAKIPPASNLPLGVIVGVVDIVGLVDIGSTSKWFIGPQGYKLANPRPLESPIRCKGRLGFWPVPEEIENEMIQQLGGVNADKNMQ